LIELWWSSPVFCEKSQNTVLYLGGVKWYSYHLPGSKCISTSVLTCYCCW